MVVHLRNSSIHQHHHLTITHQRLRPPPPSAPSATSRAPLDTRSQRRLIPRASSLSSARLHPGESSSLLHLLLLHLFSEPHHCSSPFSLAAAPSSPASPAAPHLLKLLSEPFRCCSSPRPYYCSSSPRNCCYCSSLTNLLLLVLPQSPAAAISLSLNFCRFEIECNIQICLVL